MIYNIKTGNYYYDIKSLNIRVGDTVVWHNIEGTHNVNGINNSLTGKSFDNPEIFYMSPVDSSGIIGEFTFLTPGIYKYDSSFEENENYMSGEIIVKGVFEELVKDVLEGNGKTILNIIEFLKKT